jgi:hypothetical protein
MRPRRKTVVTTAEPMPEAIPHLVGMDPDPRASLDAVFALLALGVRLGDLRRHGNEMRRMPDRREYRSGP